MNGTVNGWLLSGGVASGVAAVAHLLCIAGGARWYRAMGAGERMASAVEGGAATPHLITLAITAVLAVWSADALSGAGVIGPLPLLRPALFAITATYLLRAAALPVMLRTMADRSATFLVVSSANVLAIGAVHALGLWRSQWPK